MPGVRITGGKFVNATAAALVKKACAGVHLEPDCGTGPIGPPGAETGCPESQRAGCVTDGPVHTYWCHPPGSIGSDGIDPITRLAQVVDNSASDPGALCRQQCEHWQAYNKVNTGSNPPRLSDCHVSFGCTAWTWDPSAAGGTCFWKMWRPKDLGLSQWPVEACEGCVSGGVAHRNA